MNTAETAEAVVYNFPPKIIERQRWINFMESIRSGWYLLCWYIRANDDVLIAVYTTIGCDRTCWREIRRDGDRLSIGDGDDFPDDYTMYKALGRGKVSGITYMMPFFTGLRKELPYKGKVKIIAFPGVTVRVSITRSAEDETEESESKKKELPTRSPHVLIARPGDPAPVGVPDWRDRLQRPGLILLSYARCYDYENESWRSTPHIKKYWLAYWVKAAGDKLYFLESNNIYSEDDVDTAAPEGFSGRNYKDGGACSWGRVPWIVHVAPELFDISLNRNAPPDPRPAYIARLREIWPDVDYNRAYSLSDEKKKRGAPAVERRRKKKLWKAKMIIQVDRELETVKEN
ncbi:hypothetical protein AGMMS50268_01730 [Spirochaetia bacterium]|nr:hypothetical protein AGMMS50268_01730 [Spirochaetia bacterium]